MLDNIIIKSYTKLDFQSWIIEGISNGLNDSTISKKRAIAQMNNPDANEKDILITTASINGKCIGYRGAFPENIVLNEKEIKIGWLTTFFVNPNYRGEGIAKKLMEPIVNYYNHGIGSINSSENALKVYKKLDWNITYIRKTKFVFKLPKPRNYSIKNKLVSIISPGINSMINIVQHRILKNSYKKSFDVEYTNYVDNDLYQFILKNEKPNVLVKSQRKLNWILQYQWANDAPCLRRTDTKFYFTNNVKSFSQLGLIVKHNGKISGFLVLRNKNRHMTIPFLYYSDENKNIVFRSVLEHIIELDSFSLTTSEDDLATFIMESNLSYLFKRKKEISFSHTGQEYFESILSNLQDGDGDLFF